MDGLGQADLGLRQRFLAAHQACTHEKGDQQKDKWSEYVVDFLPKVRIEVVVENDNVEKTIKAITDAAHTGRIGDGKIFITNLEEVIRIRTGERGTKAI